VAERLRVHPRPDRLVRPSAAGHVPTMRLALLGSPASWQARNRSRPQKLSTIPRARPNKPKRADPARSGGRTMRPVPTNNYSRQPAIPAVRTHERNQARLCGPSSDTAVASLSIQGWDGIDPEPSISVTDYAGALSFKGTPSARQAGGCPADVACRGAEFEAAGQARAESVKAGHIHAASPATVQRPVAPGRRRRLPAARPPSLVGTWRRPRERHRECQLLLCR
jgi:hypothetical protein